MADLTAAQSAAYAALHRFVRRPESWAYTLSGYAGTGKTFTLSKLIKQLATDGYRVAVTAPTHQAVRVIQGMLSNASIYDVDCLTLHSLLSLKITRENGKEVLVRSGSKNHLDKYDVVIVDECSMIDHDLFDYTKRAAQTTRVKIIFTGDPAQIPPVNHDSQSPTFLLPGPRLTEIMRQAMDNPILAYCTDIRHGIERGDTVPPTPVDQHNPIIGQGIKVMPGAAFTQFLQDAFVHGDYDQYPNRFRVIAYRNAQVCAYNRQVQLLRYPMIGAAPFADGELVYIAKPLKPTMLVDAEGTTEDELLENTETLAKFDGSPSRAAHPLYPHLSAWCVTITTNNTTYSAWTLDDAGWQQHRQALNALASEITVAKALQKAGKVCPETPTGAWKDFWKLHDAFAVLRPSYAMTAHKSQGNTFENVFVDALDILRNPNRQEAMQILYVACSRATRNVIINIGRGA